jgi:T-complex protein 1 subunit theta
MAYNSAAGLGGMLKDGTQHYSNEDEGTHSASVVLRNIEACLQLCQMLSTSLGPQGRSKLVVNHLGKIIVTSDCAAILEGIEVEHPAAKLLQMATAKQNEACGDGTNLVLSFAGELLWNTLELIHKMGWQHASEIVEGFHVAAKKTQNELLPALTCEAVTDVTDVEQLLRVLKPVLMTKQMGSQDILAPLVAKACLLVMSSSGSKHKVSAEAVRTVKILGSSIAKSELIEGYVAQRGLETTTIAAQNAKVAVFASGVEASATEAKGTVLMKTADDLKNYNKTEEAKMEEIIQGIAESGVKLIVTGGNVSDMALHFMNKYELLCLRLSSKWELRRLCQATGATALVRLGAPTAEEMGVAESVVVKEVGEKTITIIKASQETKIATLLLRASTSSTLADLERAVEDGVRAVEMVCKDGRLVYGGGACEMAMAVELNKQADKYPGLEQYAIRAFAKSLQVVPRTLAVNAGWDAKVVANLQATHAANPSFNSNNSESSATICDVGVDIENEQVTSMKETQVVDLLGTKLSALKLAVDAALTVLKIDQIIMSKPSGGPKM